jgi:hypothetical protein
MFSSHLLFSGCDGVDYASECNAHAAGVSVSREGKCDGTGDLAITSTGAACSDSTSCETCLDAACFWAPVAGCLDSCSEIADTACFDPQYFEGQSTEEICATDVDLTATSFDQGDLIGDLGNMTDDMLGDLIGDLGLGNMENMTESEANDMLGGILGILEGLGLGSLLGGLLGGLDLGNMTEADLGGLLGDLGLGNMTEADLGGLLGDLGLGNMTEADLGGLLGELGLGNMTDADLDGILGDLGLGNMTETDLGGLLEGVLGMTAAPTMAPTVSPTIATIASEASGSSNKFTTAVAAWALAGSYMAFVFV